VNLAPSVGPITASGLLTGGRISTEIAAALLMSIDTVEHHLVSIYRKIGDHGRVDAAAFAFRLVLAPLGSVACKVSAATARADVQLPG
jgi:hypothetical protein